MLSGCEIHIQPKNKESMLGIYLGRTTVAFIQISNPLACLPMCFPPINSLLDRIFVKMTKRAGDFYLLKLQYSGTQTC